MLDYRWIFLGLSLLVAVPFLIYYYRRNPHPRFRPGMGEMTMVSLLVALVCLGSSFLLGGFMDDPEKFRVDASYNTPSASTVTPVDEAPEAKNAKPKESAREKSDSRSGSRKDGK